MSLDLDIIEFTGGELAGQLGILVDRKAQVFGLFDGDGEFLNTWTEYDIYEDEEAKAKEGYTPTPFIEWLNAHPFVIWGRGHDYLCGLSPSILRAVVKLATKYWEEEKQRVCCLTGNFIVAIKSNQDRTRDGIDSQDESGQISSSQENEGSAACETLP